MFILSILTGLVTVVAGIGSIFIRGEEVREYNRRTGEYETVRSNGTKVIAMAVSGGAALLTAILLLLASSTALGAGEAAVLRNPFTKQVTGEVTKQGLNWHSPIYTATVWDIRNNTVAHSPAAEEPTVDGGNVTAPRILVSDKDGMEFGIDVTVRYNVEPTKIADLTNEYVSQDAVLKKVVATDIPSVVQEIPAAYSAIEFASSERGAVRGDLLKRLQDRLSIYGINVEDVSLQKIDLPQVVKDQAAKVSSESAKLEAAKKAQETATVEAETNRIKAEGLPQEVLSQQWIEAVREAGKNGSLVITDGQVPNLTLPASK